METMTGEILGILIPFGMILVLIMFVFYFNLKELIKDSSYKYKEELRKELQDLRTEIWKIRK